MQPIRDATGILFDIQRFSVNDGPGIRTNLFFKGCPLRCQWCHNPESYQSGKQLSFRSSTCVGCMACMFVCPQKANRILKEGDGIRLFVEWEQCNACGRCVDVCCYDARSIIGKEYTVAELKEQVLVDREFYKIGTEKGVEGGITLTGGEPMKQFSFVNKFLDSIPDIHVCMETSGYASTRQFECLLGKVDLFLFDIKATDSEKHSRLCGVDNRLILKNLEYLCSQKANVIIRIPLVAGVNDDENHIKAVSELIMKYPSIQGGEIMAYHNMGIGKAEDIGLNQRTIQQEGTSQEQKEQWLMRFKNYGVKHIKIG